VALAVAVVVLLAPVTTTCAQFPFKAIPANEVNQAERGKAQEIAISLWSGWLAGKYEPLSDAFTSEMRAAMTPEVQRSAHQQTKTMFGDYKDLSFAEAAASPLLPEITIYRFRTAFSGSEDRPETRVVIDKQGQVAGFFLKPWSEEVQ